MVALLNERYSPRSVLLTDSGTTALTAALIGVLRDRPGSPVAIPAFSCYDVAAATDGAGAPALLYDVDPHTLAPDLAQLRATLRQGAAAVVAVHLYGCPGWRELLTITAQLLLEHPSLYALPAALPFLRLGETIYRKPRPLRAPTSISCPIVAATWTLAEREVEVRRRNAERLLVDLEREPGFQTISPPGHARPGYLRLPVIASAGARRAAAGAAARRLGVMPGYPRALCDLDQFGGRCLNRDAPFPGSRLLAARLCTLPTHSRLTVQDLARLARWIQAVGGA